MFAVIRRYALTIVALLLAMSLILIVHYGIDQSSRGHGVGPLWFFIAFAPAVLMAIVLEGFSEPVPYQFLFLMLLQWFLIGLLGDLLRKKYRIVTKK